MWCVSVQKGERKPSKSNAPSFRQTNTQTKTKTKTKTKNKKVIKHKNLTSSDNLITDQGNTERPGNSLTIAKHQRPDAHNQNA